MPPRTQRRNTAYLNRPNSRFGQLDRSKDGQALRRLPDLRLMSMARSKRRFRPDDFGASYLNELLSRLRRLIEGRRPSSSSL